MTKQKTKPLVCYIRATGPLAAQGGAWDNKNASLDPKAACSWLCTRGTLYRVTITARPVRRKARRS